MTTTKLFDSTVYAQRVSAAALACASNGLAGVVIGTGPELAYFTGSWIASHERLTALVIPAAAQPCLVVPQTDVADLKDSAVGDLDLDIAGWSDGDNPHAVVVQALALDEADSGAVGLGSSLTADHVLPIQKLLVGRETVLAATALKELMMAKDDAEIEQLAGAADAIDRVHAQVPGLLREGRTEAAVAADLANLILKEHDAVDFIIVGSGPNGANPHHSHSDRVLVTGEIVVVDIGGTFGVGYHSDCTRTYVVGGDASLIDDHDPQASQMYKVLEEAFDAAIASVRPGVSAEAIDQAARDVITKAGFGDAFFHRTGHGIGLAGHEEPFLLAGNDLVVTEGMAFSIEPGIYLRDRVGARIEDIVVVTADGCRQLNTQPRNLH